MAMSINEFVPSNSVCDYSRLLRGGPMLFVTRMIIIPNRAWSKHFSGISGEFGGAMVRILGWYCNGGNEQRVSLWESRPLA